MESVRSAAPASQDLDRRKFLARAVLYVGSTGLALTSLPFIASWLPAERARALGGPVRVSLGKLDPGQMIVVSWRRKPIFILRRTPQMLRLLTDHDAELKDPRSQDSAQPSYADNTRRSRRADLFVAIGICTHLGCLPKARFQPGDARLAAHWPGGFYCPCHGSRFDLAGRVFKGSPASVNLVIPPYALDGAGTLIVGEDTPAHQAA